MSSDTEQQAGTGRPSVLLGAAHLAALWALAIVQPMLSLLGGSPEFFVARDNSPGQIIVYVLVLTFGVPLVALLIELVANRIDRNLRWGIHLVLMALVASLLVLTLVKRYVEIPAAVLIGFSLLAGIAGAFAYDRFRFPRAFMDILTPAPIVLLLIFFFFSPTSRLITPDQNPEARQIEVGNPARVVMIIFDEFPLATLMENENSIDASRYPNFASLAGQSTWYKNASAAAAYTPVAVSSILTGRQVELDDLPIASDHPESLFTLLGGSYSLQVREPITKICPETLCPSPREEFRYDSSTGGLFSDLFVVSQHLLLPDSLRKHLPDVSRAFGDFGDNERKATQEASSGPGRNFAGRLRYFGRILAGARSEPTEAAVARFKQELGGKTRERLSMIHLFEPHFPWTHLPGRQVYENSRDLEGLMPDDRWWVAPQHVVDIALQRALLEVGYTDTLFGSIKSSLERRGLWNDSLVLVTADHGSSFASGVERRKATRENIGSVGSVPLFIKAPGQRTPKVVERHTCAGDILPEIASQLEIDYPWETQECPADTVTVLNPPEGSVSVPTTTMLKQRNDLLRQIQSVFTTGTGWGPVYRSGPRKELIGRSISSFRLQPETAGQYASPERRNLVKDFDPDAQEVYGQLQRGLLRGVAANQVLAITVGNRIEAVGWTFRDGLRNGTGYSILLPPSALKKDFNQVDIYLVGRGGQTLQKLYSGASPLEDADGS